MDIQENRWKGMPKQGEKQEIYFVNEIKLSLGKYLQYVKYSLIYDIINIDIFERNHGIFLN